MEISGLNPLYQTLADMMWDCEGNDQVQALIREYGRPAITVYELMVAAHYDDAIQTYEDVALAQHVLDNLLK
jgi:hypothetical protein